MLNRLTTALSRVFGGSTDGGEPSTPVEAEDPWRGLEIESDENHQRIEGRVVLPEGTFAVRRLDQDGDVQFEASFDAGETGPLDLYLVPEHFIEGYRTGGAFASDGDASAAGRSAADYEAELTASDHGPHYVLFDNTSRGETAPTGEVRAEFEIAIRE